MTDPDTAIQSLGQALRAMRLQRGLRLVDVAELAGVPRLRVIHVEAGKPGVGIGAYARVAAALGGQLDIAPAQRPTLDEIGALLGGSDG